MTGYSKISLRFWLENHKHNIATLSIWFLTCGILPGLESDDNDEIIVNTYCQLNDIIALCETNTIKKFDLVKYLVKETKDFLEDGDEIIYFIRKERMFG